MIVYISIGNSDDKLSQAEWSSYVSHVDAALIDQSIYPDSAIRVRHGNWRSLPDHPWQNACWCIDHDDTVADASELKDELVGLARDFGQDSIAWAEAPVTEFLGVETPEQSAAIVDANLLRMGLGGSDA